MLNETLYNETLAVLFVVFAPPHKKRRIIPVQSHCLLLFITMTVERNKSLSLQALQIQMEKEDQKRRKHCKQIHCKTTNQGESLSICTCVSYTSVPRELYNPLFSV